jgi:uncharacterized membrane protein SpoIIM required for sporulation
VSAAPRPQGWLAARASLWKGLAADAAAARGRSLSFEQAMRLLVGYRRLARDLASARRQWPGSTITAALETVYAAYHSLVNRPPRNAGAAMLRALREDVPAAFRGLYAPLRWVVLLFVLSTGAGWWLIATYPTLIGLIASEEMISHVERGELWTDGLLNVTPSSLLSVRIFSNNIVVSLSAFCSGIFYGLGTAYMIALNGLLLGGTLAFTHQHGLDTRLLEFMTAHGPAELSLICISGAAGVLLGEALMHPGPDGRIATFRAQVSRLASLLVVICLLLVGCGLIEGYVSPNDSYPIGSRLLIGALWWFIMWAALTGRLYGRNQTRR